MGETTTTALSGFMTSVGTMFTSVVGWLSQIGSAILADPILLAFVALPLIGLGVGIYRRIMNVN